MQPFSARDSAIEPAAFTRNSLVHMYCIMNWAVLLHNGRSWNACARKWNLLSSTNASYNDLFFTDAVRQKMKVIKMYWFWLCMRFRIHRYVTELLRKTSDSPDVELRFSPWFVLNWVAWPELFSMSLLCVNCVCTERAWSLVNIRWQDLG